ncbi:flavin reductase family protein [Amycolatopsis sp. cg5]|uniref:flavin reductase family protein n=1 Tax=Amycolatopsis sp. cg5 TaxID=3238802 RepID=UPI003523B782
MAAPWSSSTRLRAALGRFATGVAVVTTVDGADHPVGLTVNSFTSLSLDPPLVLWCLRRTSAGLPAFTTASRFAVNVLSAGQRPIAQRFASRVEDRFAEVRWHRHPLGPPLLADTAASFVCQRTQVAHGGDHVIVIGRIEDHTISAEPALIFVDGDYVALDRAAATGEPGLPKALS